MKKLIGTLLPASLTPSPPSQKMPIILHDDGGRLNELVSGQSEVILGLAGEGKCSFLWWHVVLKEQRSRLGPQVEEGAVGKYDL